MSRIGNRIINIPDNVEITVDANNNVHAKGPLGSMHKKLPHLVKVSIENKQVKVTRDNDEKEARAAHGTANALINNAVIGVTKGFVKELSVFGVGYKWAIRGKNIDLALGFSHPVQVKIPDGLTVEAPKPTEMIIKGIDKELVGLFAAQVRSWKLPEPYKGKGITYKGERIIRKEGKAAGK